MFSAVKSFWSDAKKRDTTLMLGGMGSLVFGTGPLAYAAFAFGARGAERTYRAKHDFDGTFSERWARAITFYEGTHQDSKNRAMHLVGMPFIVAGTAGLTVSSPFNPLSWPVYGPSLASFVGGWALNISGHLAFEKNNPAFAEDPLSFIAGPVWELDILRKQLSGQAGETAEA